MIAQHGYQTNTSFGSCINSACGDINWFCYGFWSSWGYASLSTTTEHDYGSKFNFEFVRRLFYEPEVFEMGEEKLILDIIHI